MNLRGEGSAQYLRQPSLSEGNESPREEWKTPSAIVSTEVLARLEWLEQGCADRFSEIVEMKRAFAGVPADEVERETYRVTAGIRASKRKRKVADSP
jgi:hypothetical protein